MELIIYAALVSVIVGSFFSITANYLASSSRDKEQAAVFANQQFVLQKISYLLNGIAATDVLPNSGASSVLAAEQATPGSYRVIRRNGNVIESSDGTDANSDGQIDSFSNSVGLTNNHVTATSLTFTRLTVNGQSAIRIQAELVGRYKTVTIDKTEYLK